MSSSFILLPSFGSLLFLLGFGSLWWGFFLHISLLSCIYLWTETHSENVLSRGCSREGWRLSILECFLRFSSYLCFCIWLRYRRFTWLFNPPCVLNLESSIAACDDKGPNTWILWCFIPYHHLSTEAEIFLIQKPKNKGFFGKSEWWSNYRPVLKENVDKTVFLLTAFATPPPFHTLFPLEFFTFPPYSYQHWITMLIHYTDVFKWLQCLFQCP
jgi:hypothetical protein